MGIVLANHQFSDVPNSNIYHADIDALVASGVTAGCGGNNFCPNASVTRGQMAAFLNRLGALGPGKTPVVNADRLDGLESTSFERSTAVLTGTARYSDTEARIVFDARTGADVRNLGFGGIEIVNTHASQRLHVAGLVAYATLGPESRQETLLPGESTTVVIPATGFHYVDVFLTRSSVNQSEVRTSKLTCSMADVGGGPSAWVSCILVGG